MRSFIFLFFALFIFSCTKTIEKKNVAANPTSYTFGAPLTKVDSAIRKAFSHLNFKENVLSYKGSGFSPMDTIDIFDSPENENDFYLSAPPSKFFYGKSHIYYIDGEPLDYTASFHLRLEQVEENKTKVVIITIRPRVVIGEETWPSGPHFVRPLKYLKVPPSTIEEYEILLEIGKWLNEKNMPPLVFPKE